MRRDDHATREARPRAAARSAARRAGRDEAGAAAKERGGIQSLARAFAILEEIARSRDGVGLAELSKRVRLHASTSFHLVRTMMQLGYVDRLADSKRYRIGRRLFTLAAGALDEIELVGLATPVLERLTRETGEYSHFAIRSGEDVVVVAKTVGSGMFQLVDRVGSVRPAHATALGKVLLAALAPRELERFLATRELERLTPKTIVRRDALLRELDEVRRRGIAFDDGEFAPEVRCAAVPVRDFAGRVAGAIGISAPVWRLSLQALNGKSAKVRAAAAALSAELGARAARGG
ncbi:MAG: IclR family transcriptional regulator [Burkholderiales bacterium]|nr:IclR family transcriptional regulator [Burkholderiales bacterium]